MTEGFDRLCEDIKIYCDITWEDETTNAKLVGIVRRGMAYLARRAGESELDFEVEGQPRALLMDYTRYARANALDDFAKNYQQELVDLYLMYHGRVDENAEEKPAE